MAINVEFRSSFEYEFTLTDAAVAEILKRSPELDDVPLLDDDGEITPGWADVLTEEAAQRESDGLSRNGEGLTMGGGGGLSLTSATLVGP